jgi:hypothetical protein
MLDFTNWADEMGASRNIPLAGDTRMPLTHTIKRNEKSLNSLSL